MNTTLTKSLITLTVLIAAAVFSLAGPVMEKNVAPVPVAECNWTGFYIGINGGVGWQQSRFTNTDDGGYDAYYFGGASTTTWDNVDYLAGGQVGFNYQWQDLVLGIEADADYSGNSINKNRRYGTESPENWNWQDIARIDFQGSVRTRLGISVLDNKALIYGTGGAAFVHGDWQSKSNYYNQYYTVYYSESYSEYWTGDDWRWGLIAGMGMEYKLNCRWSVKAEALYTWLAENTVGPSFVGNELGDFYRGRYTFADEFYSARFGINYSFGSFGH